MKSVTGGVITAKPISLPKAATLLSSFVSSDNGASQAVSAYLLRASTAFNDLKSLHGELKSSTFKETQLSSVVTDEKSQDLKAEVIDGKKKKKKKSKVTIEDDESVEIENERRKEKKKKRKSDREIDSMEKKSKTH